MNALIGDQLSDFIAVIEQPGVPALRVGFTLAVIGFCLPEPSSGGDDTNFSIAIQTSRTMCRSCDTIARKKSYLSGPA